MNQFLPLLGKALNIEGFAAGENGCSLTLVQLKEIEAALSSRDQRLAELAEQVEALKAKPAEDSQAVIDDYSKHEPLTPFDEFAQTVNDARKLYDLVP